MSDLDANPFADPQAANPFSVSLARMVPTSTSTYPLVTDYDTSNSSMLGTARPNLPSVRLSQSLEVTCPGLTS